MDMILCIGIIIQAIMNRKLVAAIIVILILSLSIYELFGILKLPSKQLDITSKLRFMCFIGIHFMVIITMIILTRIEGTYNYIFLTFVNCMFMVVAMTVCETMVRQIENGKHYNFKKNDGGSESIELTYLNIYFLVYMYAIIGFLIMGLFLLITEILICWEEHKINWGVNKSLQKMEFKLQFAQIQCSICLEFLNDRNGDFVEIKNCKHLFHRRCLVEWILMRKTCPLCRENIFEEDERDI